MPCDQHYDCRRCRAETEELADRLNARLSAVREPALALLKAMVKIAGTKQYAKIGVECNALLDALRKGTRK